MSVFASKSKKLFIFSMMLGMISTPIACGPSYFNINEKSGLVPQTTAVVCVDVPEAQLPKVTQAIEAWGMSISNWKKLVPYVTKPNEDCDYTIVEETPPKDVPVKIIAITSSIFGRSIKLYKNRYEMDTLGVVLHELGHALGAHHMPGTMMNPQIIIGVYKCPDAPTIGQVAAANKIDPSTLSWCIY